MKTLTLTPEEINNLYLAVVGRKNLIETGQASLSAIDAQNMKMPVRALSSDQQELILELKKLLKKLNPV